MSIHSSYIGRKTALNCCQTEFYVPLFPEHCTVMRKLHLEKGIVTEEECRGIKRIFFSNFEWFNQLSLVLCVKPKKHLETAIKILEVHKSELSGFMRVFHGGSPYQALGPLLGERII